MVLPRIWAKAIVAFILAWDAASGTIRECYPAFAAGDMSAIRTKSARVLAPILRMTAPR